MMFSPTQTLWEYKFNTTSYDPNLPAGIMSFVDYEDNISMHNKRKLRVSLSFLYVNVTSKWLQWAVRGRNTIYCVPPFLDGNIGLNEHVHEYGERADDWSSIRGEEEGCRAKFVWKPSIYQLVAVSLQLNVITQILPYTT